MTRSWYKAASAAATQVITEVPSDTENAIYYVTDFNSALAVIDSTLSGAPIQIGFLERGGNTETILFGSVALSDAEQGQLLNCLQELVGSMNDDIRAKAKTKTNKKKQP